MVYGLDGGRLSQTMNSGFGQVKFQLPSYRRKPVSSGGADKFHWTPAYARVTVSNIFRPDQKVQRRTRGRNAGLVSRGLAGLVRTTGASLLRVNVKSPLPSMPRVFAR